MVYMIIPRHLVDQMIAHARARAPQECCGIIATRDNQAVRLYECTNVAESEYRYEIDVVEQFEIVGELDDAGLEMGGIYHSHTHAPPAPSLMDVQTAYWPDVMYVIVGPGQEPEVCAWRIAEATVREEPLEIRG